MCWLKKHVASACHCQTSTNHQHWYANTASAATVPSVEEIQSMTMEQLREKLVEIVNAISSNVWNRLEQVAFGASG